jgi:hypothetical protein
MATNDTDPQRIPPSEEDASSTDPGAPPDAAADVAAGLLADLAKTSVPTEEVSETEGHAAAAYALAAHRPPRANDKTVENPAVFVNATVPLPQPPSSARVKLGPPAPSVVSMNGAPTVPGGARLFERTSLGERARKQTRILLASIAGVVVAGLVAILVVGATSSSLPRPAPSSSTSSSSSAPAASSAVVVETTTATVSAPVVPPAESFAASSPPVVSASKPARSARPHPSGRSSGTFAAPDRTF